MVIDVTEWEYETHMRHAKDRVVCVEHAYLVLFWTPVTLSCCLLHAISIAKFTISQSEAVRTVLISRDIKSLT